MFRFLPISLFSVLRYAAIAPCALALALVGVAATSSPAQAQADGNKGPQLAHVAGSPRSRAAYLHHRP